MPQSRLGVTIMNRSRLTKSHIVKNAQHSLGRSLQRTRRRLGFDLETVTEQTHISAHDIDLLEIGKSRRFNHAIKLALFYDCEIEIGLTRRAATAKKRVRPRRQASPPLIEPAPGRF